VVDANAHRMTSTYDAAGRLTGREDPLGNRITFTYDAAGRLATRVDGKGRTTTYSYDDDGRQTGVEYQDGTRVTYVFDDAGRRTSMADATGTTTYTLNSGGHLTAVAQPGGKTVTYTLEAAGRRQAMIDPDSGRTTYSYDGANRVTSLLNPFAETTTWAYDALGRATTITLANGAVTTATFDAAGRQTGVRHSKNGTQLQSFAYSYDNAGRRTGVVEGNSDRVTWTYDLAGKLTREQRSGTNAYDTTYAYDPVGNRLTMLTGGVTTTYSYNAGDELTVANEGGTLTTYSYDANGNTTGENAAGSLTTYAWDDENRLKVLTPSCGDPATMTYDATGLRRTRAVGAATTRFIWDGQKLILETDGGGTTQAQFTLNLGVYGDLISQRRSSTSRWYHFDALGSTDRLTGADGSATDTYIYKAFGPLAASTGSTTNPFRYVGKLGYYDQGSGPLYVRARWLRPTTGSWLSVDPIPTKRPYAYADGTPLSVVDPSGRAGTEDESLRECMEDCYTAYPDGGLLQGICLAQCAVFHPKEWACLQLASDGARYCFECAEELFASWSYCPMKACDKANALCGSHVECGACGSRAVRAGMGGCHPSKINDDATFFRHGPCARPHGSADKMAHCYATCMLRRCYGKAGMCMWYWTVPRDNDPEDVRAEGLGFGCAMEYVYRGQPWVPEIEPDITNWHARHCIRCCALRTYDMECD